MTSPQRKAVKAGKHERIRKMMEKLRPEQPKPMFDEQLLKLLEVKQGEQ
jgi:hypothetical protein